MTNKMHAHCVCVHCARFVATNNKGNDLFSASCVKDCEVGLVFAMLDRAKEKLALGYFQTNTSLCE